MDPARLRAGEWLAGVAAVVLLAALFLPWYGNVVPAEAHAFAKEHGLLSVSGFEAFDVLDVVLVAVALLGGLVAVTGASTGPPAIPVKAAVVTIPVSLVAWLSTTFRLIDQPGDNSLLELRAGAWVGWLACGAVLVGAWLTIRDERTDTPESRAHAEEILARTPVRPAPPAGS